MPVSQKHHQISHNFNYFQLQPLDAEINIDQDTFQSRKKARIEELRNKSVELPQPKTKPLTSAPTNHEIGGYMPGRLEFEHELENDAEVLIKDLEFGKVLGFKGDSLPDTNKIKSEPQPVVKNENGESDEQKSGQEEEVEEESPSDLQLKLALMEIYNGRIDKRLMCKRVIFDRGLLEHKKVS